MLFKTRPKHPGFLSAWVHYVWQLPLPSQVRRLLVACVVRPFSWYVVLRYWLQDFGVGLPPWMASVLHQHREGRDG